MYPFRQIAVAAFAVLTTSCSYLEFPAIDPVRFGQSGSTDGSTFAQSIRGKLSGIPESGHTFADAFKDSASDPLNGSKAELFLQTGIALSDELCNEWFEKLAQAQVKDMSARDFAGNFGALSAVLLSVTNAGTAAVGSVAAGTNFAQKTLDSEMANYIIAPDIGVVRRAIFVERAIVATDAEMRLSSTELKYPTALQLLISYDNLCSHIEVKRIVNASISSNADNAQGGGGISAFYDSLIAAGTRELKEILAANSVVDSNSIEALYALILKPNEITPDAATNFKKLLVTDGIYDAKGNVRYKSGSPDTALRVILGNINILGDLDKKLAQDNALKSPTQTGNANSNSGATPGGANNPKSTKSEESGSAGTGGAAVGAPSSKPGSPTYGGWPTFSLTHPAPNPVYMNAITSKAGIPFK